MLIFFYVFVILDLFENGYKVFLALKILTSFYSD